MRTVSTLIGLTLFALASTASAQEAAPAAEKAAPAADKAAPAVEKAEATPLEPGPAKPEPAESAVAAAPAPAQPAAGPRRFQLGLSFMPMAAGRFTYSPTGEPKTVDAGFAYGFSLSGVYEILPGLLVGLAPQFTLNVRDKNASDAETAKEIDLLARVAYAYKPVDTIAVYAEVLPGYSLILPPTGISPKGFVVAFGAGSTMDITERVFANFGFGYQIGFQNRKQNDVSLETRTKYVRVTLGGGMRF